MQHEGETYKDYVLRLVQMCWMDRRVVSRLMVVPLEPLPSITDIDALCKEISGEHSV